MSGLDPAQWPDVETQHEIIRDIRAIVCLGFFIVIVLLIGVFVFK